MKPKSILRSRTAALALLTALAGLLACFNDPAAQILRDHSAVILVALGTANLILRRITHGRVEFFPDGP